MRFGEWKYLTTKQQKKVKGCSRCLVRLLSIWSGSSFITFRNSMIDGFNSKRDPRRINLAYVVSIKISNSLLAVVSKDFGNDDACWLNEDTTINAKHGIRSIPIVGLPSDKVSFESFCIAPERKWYDRNRTTEAMAMGCEYFHSNCYHSYKSSRLWLHRAPWRLKKRIQISIVLERSCDIFHHLDKMLLRDRLHDI